MRFSLCSKKTGKHFTRNSFAACTAPQNAGTLMQTTDYRQELCYEKRTTSSQHQQITLKIKQSKNSAKSFRKNRTAKSNQPQRSSINLQLRNVKGQRLTDKSKSILRLQICIISSKYVINLMEQIHHRDNAGDQPHRLQNISKTTMA